MNRRKFLWNLGIVGAGVLVGPQVALAQNGTYKIVSETDYEFDANVLQNGLNRRTPNLNPENSRNQMTAMSGIRFTVHSDRIFSVDVGLFSKEAKGNGLPTSMVMRFDVNATGRIGNSNYGSTYGINEFELTKVNFMGDGRVSQTADLGIRISPNTASSNRKEAFRVDGANSLNAQNTGLYGIKTIKAEGQTMVSVVDGTGQNRSPDFLLDQIKSWTAGVGGIITNYREITRKANTDPQGIADRDNSFFEKISPAPARY